MGSEARIAWLIRLFAVAIAVLVTTPGSAPAEPYKRSLYPHWVDEDGDCQDTRQEVLIAESLVPPVLDAAGCTVVSGRWHDPYTDQFFTKPGKLDVDHMVPLKEAHESGGLLWGRTRRRAFANDLGDERSLIAVSASANRQKAHKDPSAWLPKNVAFRCTYVAQWLAVKARWELAQDVVEANATAEIVAACATPPVTPDPED